MRANITFLGGPETGNVGSVEWGRFTFELNKAVLCDDPHIIAKARNRFFKVEELPSEKPTVGDEDVMPPLPRALAREAAEPAKASPRQPESRDSAWKKSQR